MGVGVAVGVGVGLGVGDAAARGLASDSGFSGESDNSGIRNQIPDSTVATTFRVRSHWLVQASAIPTGGRTTSAVTIRAVCCHQRRGGLGTGIGAGAWACGGGYMALLEAVRGAGRASLSGRLKIVLVFARNPLAPSVVRPSC